VRIIVGIDEYPKMGYFEDVSVILFAAMEKIDSDDAALQGK
jgi:hypothetical protein